jgi:hypothetical protein
MKKAFIFLAILVSTAAHAETADVSSEVAAIKACQLNKIGSNDWLQEIPGTSVVVNPAEVKYGVIDLDVFTKIDGLTWAAFRASELTRTDISGKLVIQQARLENKLVRLTKVDGVKSIGGVDNYDVALKIEILDQQVPEGYDSLKAVLESCVQEK